MAAREIAQRLSFKTREPDRNGFGQFWQILPYALIVVFIVLWCIYERDSALGRQNLTTGPIPLDSTTQVQVTYPRRLHMDDQGVEAGKKIVVEVAKADGAPPETLQITIVPAAEFSAVVRWLTRGGIESGGQLSITAHSGASNPVVLYAEHANIPLPLAHLWNVYVPFEIEITSPSRPTMRYIVGSMEAEGPLANALRDMLTTLVSTIALFSILVLAVIGLLREWWDLRQKCHSLYLRMMELCREHKWEQTQILYRDEYLPLARRWYRHRRIYELYREAQSHIHYHLAGKAHRAGNHAEAVKELKEARRWTKPTPEAQRLSRQLEDLDSPDSDKRARALEALDHALDERDDVALQTEGLCGLLMLLERTPGALQATSMTTVANWLRASPCPLEYNPFETTKAEDDPYLEAHFIEHHAYSRLWDSTRKSMALFATSGGGKTSSRMMLKNYLDGRPNLVVEYTDFGPSIASLVSAAAEIVTKGRIAEKERFDLLTFQMRGVSIEDHIQEILRKAASALGVNPSNFISQDTPIVEQLKRTLGQMKEEGYETLYILVDNLEGYAETQVHPWMGELLVRPLLGNFDLLDMPGISFRFFLPMEWKERLLKYGGFTTGRIEVVDLVWTMASLWRLLRVRLAQATRRAATRPLDSLMAFVDISWPRAFDLDQVLIRKARSSPRDLIALTNMLLQHRAALWDESSREATEWYIRIADWATLLDFLLREREM